MFPLLYIAINYNYIIKLFFDMYEYAMQINIAQIFLFKFSLNIYYLYRFKHILDISRLGVKQLSLYSLNIFMT